MTERNWHGASDFERLLVPIETLTLDPANLRTHPDRNLRAIRDSLTAFGQHRAAVVQRRPGDGALIVRVGNGMLEAARSLGWSHLAAVVVEEDDVRATARALADNRAGELAAWDLPALERTIAALGDEGFPASSLGWDAPDLAALTAAVAAQAGPVASPTGTDADAAPEPPASPVTRLGDRWTLGDHVLVCGDSTDPATVARLLAGETPFLMVTDPPYGVEYDPEWRQGLRWSDTRATGIVHGDDRSDWTAAWRLFAGDVAYVWHGGLHAATVVESMKAADLLVRAQIIWTKQMAPISRGAYRWQHEPCWYAVRKGATARWCGDRSQTTVWDIRNLNTVGGRSGDEADVASGHGTQKPVECMERPMRHHGAPGDIVYEPFLGSGTSLIAAERVRRRCRAIELDPAYCDVAVERWQQWSGKKAVRSPA